jgi:DNA invertase Pin-like site-specific DNA recombinase
MSELISIVDDLKGRGIGLKVLTGAGAAINTTRPEGRLILGVLTAFAEFERELIRERTKAGMRAARRRGKRVAKDVPHPDSPSTHETLTHNARRLTQYVLTLGAGRARSD